MTVTCWKFQWCPSVRRRLCIRLVHSYLGLRPLWLEWTNWFLSDWNLLRKITPKTFALKSTKLIPLKIVHIRFKPPLPTAWSEMSQQYRLNTPPSRWRSALIKQQSSQNSTLMLFLVRKHRRVADIVDVTSKLFSCFTSHECSYWRASGTI